MYDDKTYLEHFGVKGMKWGVRKKAEKLKADWKRGKEEGTALRKKHDAEKAAAKVPIKKMTPNEKTSATTKRVMADYNKMNDQEFKNKYQTSKKTYSNRVKKYGDPANSKRAKTGRKLAARQKKVDAKRAANLARIENTSYAKLIGQGVLGLAASNALGLAAISKGQLRAGVTIARFGRVSSLAITTQQIAIKRGINKKAKTRR